MTMLNDLTEAIRAAVGTDSGIGKTVKYDFRGDGFILIGKDSVTNDDGPADLTMTISLDDFMRMGTGELDPMGAALTGRLKFSNMFTALGLQAKVVALMDRIPRA
jgi:putative sterol carrier protein